jgi:hypothetical protein
VAKRFVAAYTASNFNTIDQLWVGTQPTDFRRFHSVKEQSLFRLVPELLPRSFHDLWTGSRRIVFHWTLNGQVVTFDMNVATPQGLIAGPLGIYAPVSDDDEFGVEMGHGPIFFDRSLVQAPE